MTDTEVRDERKQSLPSKKMSLSKKERARSQSARPLPPAIHIRKMSEPPPTPTTEAKQLKLNSITDAKDSIVSSKSPSSLKKEKRTVKKRGESPTVLSQPDVVPDPNASSSTQQSPSKSKASSSRNPTKRSAKDPFKSPKDDKSRRKSKSKKKNADSHPEASHELALSRSIFGHMNKLPKDFENYNTVIHVQKTDVLLPSHHLRRPLVRIHILDAVTGSYISKKDKSIPATSFNESKNLDYILPILTKEFPLLLNQSHSAKWNEKIYLNEEYLNIVREHVLVFFEILNVVPPTKSLWRPIGDGWHRVAWAFLSLIGGNGKSNTEKDVRLQLYQYPWKFRGFGFQQQTSVPEVYYLWRSGRRKKYPSSMYVSIFAAPKKDIVQVMQRPIQPVEKECGKLTYEQMLEMYHNKKKLVDPMMRSLIQRKSRQHVWRRKDGQRCRMPNRLLYRIDPGAQGSFTCSFSNQGLYLAVACVHQRSYPIRIYDVVTGDRIAQLEGHQDLVYQLSWSCDDHQLLSVSSDGSARIWSIVSGNFMQSFLLQHPTFVYTGCFHPRSDKESGVVMTGAYDGIIRVWTYSQDARMAKGGFMKPVKKFLGHESNVNSIIFDKDGSKMYSGDGQGVLKIWSNRSLSPQSNRFGSSEAILPVEYDCIKSIDLVGGHAIQSLTLHNSNRKILVHCANQSLHCLDTRIFRFLTHFQVPYVRDDPPLVTSVSERKIPFTRNLGPTSDPLPSSGLWPAFLSPAHRIASPTWIRSTFSPCGFYVLCGSQKGTVYVWNADTGLLVACYDKQHLSKWEDGSGPIVAISFHPQEHMFALSSWGEAKTVKVWTWDEGLPEIKLAETQSQESSNPQKPLHLPAFDVDKIIAQSMGSKIMIGGNDVPIAATALLPPSMPNVVSTHAKESDDSYERRPLGVYDGKFRAIATS